VWLFYLLVVGKDPLYVDEVDLLPYPLERVDDDNDEGGGSLPVMD